MASVLSRLSILLHADTAQFRRDLRDTQTRLGRFGVGAKQAMKVAAVGVAAGAATAVSAIGSIAKEQIAAAAEFERFAQLSNTNAVEFQRLAAGAAKYGIEADKLSDIYKDMNDRVGDFVQTGGGPMADFFENIGPKVGVTAAHFKDLSGPDALQLFYSSLEKANLSQADMTFYMEAMAGDLTALQPLLQDGGKGFKDLGDQAQNAGAIMNADTLAATKKLNSDLAALKTSFQGVKVQIFEAVLPALQVAVDWFANNREEIADNIEKVIEFGSALKTHITNGFNTAKTIVQNAVDKFNSLKTTFEENKTAITALTAGALVPATAALITFKGAAILSTASLAAQKIALVASTVATKAWTLASNAAAISTRALGVAIRFATGPIGIATTVIGALVAAGVYLYQNWDDISAKAKVLWSNIKTTISNAVENTKQAIITKFDSIKSKMLSIGQDIINGLINGIKARAQAAVDTIKNTASNMYQSVKNFFVVRSPSRLMRTLGNDIGDGLIIGVKDKKSDAYNAAVDVALSLLNGIQSTRRDIALFGNDSAVAAFDYDVMIGKYDNVAESLRQQYRADLLKHENMKREEQQRAKVMSAIKDRAAKFQDDQSSAADAFSGLDINGPQTEVEKLRQAYENKMAVVDRFEQLHTDRTAQAEAARTRLREQHNQDIAALDQARFGGTINSTIDLFRTMLSESSTGYKSIFAVQQAYDFAQAQSASFAAIAKAWGSAPFPTNLPAVLFTTLKTGIIPAAIKAIKPQGFASGGYTGDYPTDMPIGPVHGKEFVTHAAATKKYRPELEAMHNGTYERNANTGGDINVNVSVTMDGKSSVQSDTQYGKQIGQGLASVVVKEVTKMMRPNGQLDRQYARR